jgi:hypothetical protein
MLSSRSVPTSGDADGAGFNARRWRCNSCPKCRLIALRLLPGRTEYGAALIDVPFEGCPGGGERVAAGIVAVRRRGSSPLCGSLSRRWGRCGKPRIAYQSRYTARRLRLDVGDFREGSSLQPSGHGHELPASSATVPTTCLRPSAKPSVNTSSCAAVGLGPSIAFVVNPFPPAIERGTDLSTTPPRRAMTGLRHRLR